MSSSDLVGPPIPVTSVLPAKVEADVPGVFHYQNKKGHQEKNKVQRRSVGGAVHRLQSWIGVTVL
jgi:hypothetical protein